MTQPSSWSHYAAPRHAMRRLLISCHGAGEQSGPQPPFRRRSLPTRGLVYISEGHGEYEEYEPHGRKVPVLGPAVIWLTPGTLHGYGSDARGWSEHWVLFEGESFAAFEASGLGGHHRPVQALARPVDDADEIDHPELLPDIMFGAAACLTVDGWGGAHILDAWSTGTSSLRTRMPS